MPTLDDSHHHQFSRFFAEHEPAVRTFVRTLLLLALLFTTSAVAEQHANDRLMK